MRTATLIMTAFFLLGITAGCSRPAGPAAANTGAAVSSLSAAASNASAPAGVVQSGSQRTAKTGASGGSKAAAAGSLPVTVKPFEAPQIDAEAGSPAPVAVSETEVAPEKEILALIEEAVEDEITPVSVENTAASEPVMPPAADKAVLESPSPAAANIEPVETRAATEHSETVASPAPAVPGSNLAAAASTTAAVANRDSTGTRVEPAPSGQMSIKGKMRINFDSRMEGGGSDTYDLNLFCGDSVAVKGQIIRSTKVSKSLLGSEERNVQFRYDVIMEDMQGLHRNSAKLGGVVPVSGSGVYDLSNLMLQAKPGDRAAAGRFSGRIQGRSQEKKGFLRATYTRLLGRKKLSFKVANVDPLRFDSVGLPAGPGDLAGAASVSGNLDYDYDTGNWLTNGITIRTKGSQPDKITGSIKWSPDEKRTLNGRGQYEFNLRFNEERISGGQNEEAFFEAAADEEAFFAAAADVPALQGVIRYRDSFQSGADDAEPQVVSSEIQYDLTGDKLTREQLINFLKLWLLLAGPVNDE